MARSETTKQIAKRIDHTYWTRPNAILASRRLLTVIICILALAWVGFASIGGKDRGGALYNPGHVSAAHAHFENNCSACHTQVEGKFIRSVTDSACMKCHEGAVHHPNQTQFVFHKAGHPDDGRLSTNCSTCHVEHRGREVLAGVSNENCTQCHADLNSHTKGGNPSTPAVVTAFAANTHPDFGRQLRGSEGKWQDPTNIKFNHSKHLPMADINNNCSLCHRLTEKSSSALPAVGSAGQVGGRRYMLPVTYEQHCAKCHVLKVDPTGPTLAHQPMDIVRAQIAAFPMLYRQMIANDPEREQKLTLTIRSPRPGGKPTIKKLSEADWVEKQLKGLVEGFDSDASTAGKPQWEQLTKALGDAPAAEGSVWNDAAMSKAEVFAAAVRKDSCALCHEVQGVAPVVFDKMKSTPPATQPATAPAKLEYLHTVASGMPKDRPRRWFVHSWFDHDAHRSESCQSCHGDVAKSALTSDVMMPQMSSCVACHHPADSRGVGTGNACISCHGFHDRTLEKGSLALSTPAPTTKPAE